MKQSHRVIYNQSIQIKLVKGTNNEPKGCLVMLPRNDDRKGLITIRK